MLGSRTSRWTAGTLALCVLLLVGFWFLLVAPRRAEAADLRLQQEQAEAANDKLTMEISQLKAQSAALPQRQAELAKIKREFPPQLGLAKLIRDVDTMATQAGVRLDSLNPGAPVAVAGSGAAAAGGTTAAGTKAGAKATASAMLQVPVTIQVTGDYFQMARFTKLVQQMERATLIGGLQIAESQDAKKSPGDVTTTLTGAIFVLPDADPSTETGATTPSTAAGGTSSP